MENQKRKSIIIISYRLINVLYGASFGALVFWLGFYILHFVNSSINIPIVWNAFYSIDLVHRFGPYNNGGQDFNLYVAGAKMILYSSSEKLAFLSFGYYSIIILATAFVVSSLRKILKNIYEGELFAKENISLIKWIGTILIVTPIILDLTKYLLVDSLPSTLVVGIKQWNSVSLGYLYKPTLGSIDYLQWFYLAVGGLIIMVLAEVFKYGFHLKQENDLTV